jgi:hypothetical protein
VERPTHSRVVITMPPPRKTHLEALIEKARSKVRAFSLSNAPTLSGLSGRSDLRAKPESA